MQPQDCAKLAYQSALGPAHTVAEREQVLRGLLQEWSRIPADSRPRPPEKIGNGLCRLYLAGTDHLPLAAQLAADLLCMTAERCQGTPADLEAGLAVLEAAELTREGKLTAQEIAHEMERRRELLDEAGEIFR